MASGSRSARPQVLLDNSESPFLLVASNNPSPSPLCSEFLEHGISKTQPLTDLRGLRIGVDGHKWLASLGAIQEPFVSRSPLKDPQKPQRERERERQRERRF